MTGAIRRPLGVGGCAARAFSGLADGLEASDPSAVAVAQRWGASVDGAFPESLWAVRAHSATRWIAQ